jgi:hypothetical protein
MGGIIGPARGDESPRFAVFAAKDPGLATAPGTDLQRAQIVKGWVDADGETHERVFDVAGDADNGATVDTETCAPLGRGSSELCTVWEDPEFDRSERAFYYVRLLENPTCRWHTLTCKAEGVDPFSPDCAAQAAAAGGAFARCCVAEDEDPFLSRVIQERAWSSAVWYEPEAIAGIEGTLTFDGGGASGDIELTMHIGALPPDADPRTTDLVVRVSDDDTIHEAVFAASPLGAGGQAGHFAVADARRGYFLEVGEGGAARLDIVERGVDLSRAARTDHMLTVSVELGSYSSSHTRLWKFTGSQLSVGDRGEH